MSFVVFGSTDEKMSKRENVPFIDLRSSPQVKIIVEPRETHLKRRPDQSQLYSKAARADSARVSPISQNPLPVMETNRSAPSGS